MAHKVTTEVSVTGFQDVRRAASEVLLDKLFKMLDEDKGERPVNIIQYPYCYSEDWKVQLNLMNYEAIGCLDTTKKSDVIGLKAF
jgi:hypothetical protein